MLATAVCTYCGAVAPAASALNPLKPICGAAGLIGGIAGKACKAVQSGGRLLNAGKKLLGGHVGGAVSTVISGGGGAIASAATAAAGLAAIVASVVGGARFALQETARVMSRTTTPQLRTTWFSATYWRMAEIAAVLTLPFLFAAAVQALIRSDLGLLVRAAFGYLPLAMLAVGIAAPLTMLLLAASDQLCAVISAAAGNASDHFLRVAGITIGGFTAALRSPFLVLLVGLFTIAGALVLWAELLMRDAAVYVIVLMLPLAFAALAWPARRIWAVRAVELLVALIFSKFAIVAVLSLGGAALDNGLSHGSAAAMLAGLVLVVMAAFAPWALLRLLPLAEIASGAVASLRAETRPAAAAFVRADGWARSGHEAAASAIADMRRDADAARLDVASPSRRSESATGGPSAETEDIPAAVHEPAGDETPDGADTATDGEERRPDLDGMWQAPNGSWRTLTLDLDDDWPSPTVWRPDAQTHDDGGA